MITNAFREDSEAFVFQKSQVSCQGLVLQKNIGFKQVFKQGLLLQGLLPGFWHHSNTFRFAVVLFLKRERESLRGRDVETPPLTLR